jgi:ribosomal protein S18 acetylase RimI-like enzyme
MSTKRISIRRAGTDDNQRLAALGRETFLDSFAADNSPLDMADYLEQSFGPDIQAAELADPASGFLIAEAEGDPVGYARLVEALPPPCIDAKKPIQLARLYADKGWIGSGVGAALMRACIADVQKRQGDGIWLGVWEKNGRAIRFYRQWGFRQVGTQPFVLGKDRQIDLVLWLPLGSGFTTHRP